MGAQDKVSSKAAETPDEDPVVPSPELEPETPVPFVAPSSGYVCQSNIRHNNVLYSVGNEFPIEELSDTQLDQLVSSGALKLSSIEGA